MEEVEAPPLMEKKKSRFRRVCVFCGSSPGKKAAYHAAAVQLGQQLVERGIGLVYGGGSVGLMGLVSRAVHNAGGHVIGVVPKSLLPRELIGETPGEVKAVSGMHQRKAEMTRHSDAFVALPGGYGTLEELLEVITWAQLGIHDKPVGLLNVEGYYDSLLSFIDKAVDEGFVPPRRKAHRGRGAHARRAPRRTRGLRAGAPRRFVGEAQLGLGVVRGHHDLHITQARHLTLAAFTNPGLINSQTDIHTTDYILIYIYLVLRPIHITCLIFV